MLFDINMKPEIELSLRKKYKDNEATKEKRERQETQDKRRKYILRKTDEDMNWFIPSLQQKEKVENCKLVSLAVQ